MLFVRALDDDVLQRRIDHDLGIGGLMNLSDSGTESFPHGCRPMTTATVAKP